MEYASGNIFIRTQGAMAKGAHVIGHKHNFDHTTYIVKGSFRIEQIEPITFVDGEPTEFKKIREVEKYSSSLHNWVLIKANTYHRLTSLEDNSIYHCIYSHRTPQGEIVQEYDGWQKAIN